MESQAFRHGKLNINDFIQVIVGRKIICRFHSDNVNLLRISVKNIISMWDSKSDKKISSFKKNNW